MAKKATQSRRARKGAAAKKRPPKVASKARKSAGQRKRSKRPAAEPRKRRQASPTLKSIVEALDKYVAARRTRSAPRAGEFVAAALMADGEDWEAKLGRARVEMRLACESTPAFG
ncbi:MAG: hypothetical protein GEV06_19180 [Luteitalea sp.]|nr:hypothetical protein [Luteitalea sp.]